MDILLRGLGSVPLRSSTWTGGRFALRLRPKGRKSVTGRQRLCRVY